MDQLRPSFHGVAPALCDRMDCAHPACLIPCSVLRRAVRVHRRCLQRLRAPSIGPCGRHAGVRAYAAYGEAPIARCPCELHDRYAGRDRRAARRLRSHMCRPDPPLAARSPLPVGRDLATARATVKDRVHLKTRIPAKLHKSMTTSRIGCEQQTRRLPSAGFSSGSGRRKTPAEEPFQSAGKPILSVVQFACWMLRPQYFNPAKLFRRRFYWARTP